jgi:hypothetical protein
MIKAIVNIVTALIGLLLTPIWLPASLIIYIIKKWQRKEH